MEIIDPGSVRRKKTKVSLNGDQRHGRPQWTWIDLEKQTNSKWGWRETLVGADVGSVEAGLVVGQARYSE